MTITDGKTSYKAKHKLPVAVPLVLGAVLLVIAVLVFFMIRTVKTSVYSERKSLLGQLTESSAQMVNDEMTHIRFTSNLITDNAVSSLAVDPDMEHFFAQATQYESYRDLLFFFVDENGKYYCSDGTRGKVTDTTYYTASSDEQLFYISTLPHLGTDNSYIIFRNRLSSPITVTVDGAETDVVFCGLLYSLNELNATVSAKFTGDNNTFIYDDSTGVMMYKYFGIDLLIDGFNIYPKFSACSRPYGEDPAVLEAACRNEEILVVSLVIGGSEYYFCSAPIDTLNWSVAFIVQSKYMDTLSGSAFSDVIIYIAVIALLLAGAVVYITVVSYNSQIKERTIRETNQLNEALEKATQAKSDFLSNMSHDIRTPINGIMGMTTIAKSVPGNPQKTVDCLNKIDNASQHLLSLVNDVLDMSRIERGKTEIAQKPIDIRAVCDNCTSIIRGQMSGRRLNLVAETDCDHPKLIGDDLHLRQVFINILGNAVKFTPDGGTIWFRVKETAFDGAIATLSFEFEDTGIGMTKEFLPKVFDVFTQDEGGARSTYKGTGLGMPITKQLTELMGGTVTVESELHKGSKFTVTIPFPVDSAPAEQTEAEKATAKSIQGVKLLLAEDNELNMEIATELLSDAGAVITGVENGRLALEAFATNAPGTFDAILMDVMMPEMNGLDATKAIRALDREDAQTIPILAMTANAFESDIRATREAGMDAHLVKPINIDEVVGTIARFMKYPPRKM